MPRKLTKNYDDSNIPEGKWYPEIGDIVFVPKFRLAATVLDVVPILEPTKIRAKEIYYLVELHDGEPNIPATRTGVKSSEFIDAAWVMPIKR